MTVERGDSAETGAAHAQPSAGATLPVGRPTQWHRDVLALALVIVALSFLLGISAGGRVALPATEISIPSLCLWKNTTGVDCPGCGLTRCFVAMAHADWRTAYRYHPFGMLLFAFTILQIPYQSMQCRRIARGRGRFRLPMLGVLVWLLLGAMLTQWLLKITGLVVF